MPQLNAKSLVGRYKIDVKHQLYRKDGTWFHTLTEFPAALLDENGYIRFEAKADYEKFFADASRQGIRKSDETNWITVKGLLAESCGQGEIFCYPQVRLRGGLGYP